MTRDLLPEVVKTRASSSRPLTTARDRTTVSSRLPRTRIMGCCGPKECVHGPFHAFSSPSRASRARSTGRAVSASPPRIGQQRGIAPRRDARAAVIGARPVSRRVDRDGTRGLGDSAARRRLARPAATRAPTAFNRRIEFDTRTDSKHRPTRCARARSVPDWDACSKKDRRVFFSRARRTSANRVASSPTDPR